MVAAKKTISGPSLSIMMQRNRPPFRAEHIGSLKRPAEIIQKREEYASGGCSLASLRDAEDVAIKQIIDLQKSAGMKTITDGEFRRFVFFEGVYNQLEGIETVLDSPMEYFAPYLPYRERIASRGISCICRGKLRRTMFLYGRDFLGLKKLVDPEDVKHIKLTICGPEVAHFHHGSFAYDESVYACDEDYFVDVVQIYREELKELYENGCRNIQIDEPNLAFFCDEVVLRAMKDAGIDAEKRLSQYIHLLNDCVRDRPHDMTIGVHLCRGNTKDGFATGGYGRIATQLFQGVDADCFYLEYDFIRAGGFEPLRHLPSNKIVVLGLVSTRTAELEDPEKLSAKIYEAAKVIADGRAQMGIECDNGEKEALNQICISPQCGFSSGSVSAHDTSEEDIRRKLLLVAQIANSIWGYASG